MFFVIYSCKTGKCWNQNIFTNLQNFVKLWKNSKNSPNNAKIYRVVPRRGDRALILTCMDKPMSEVFPHYCLFFFISSIFRGKQVVKVGTKVQNLGPSLFHENSPSFKFFQTMFSFAKVILLVRISAILDHIWSSKRPKTSQKGSFHICWIGTQNFENC